MITGKRLRPPIFAMAALALSACAVPQPPPAAVPPLDVWTRWQQDFQTAMDACVQAKGADCLAKAFEGAPRPPEDNPQHSVSGDLTYDLRTAQAMLAVPNAVNALYGEYGIDNVAYLGTGFSVPVTATGVDHYWQAVQREFFLPNLYAQTIVATACPTADPDVWTWRLSMPQMQAALDKPIAQIFKAAQGDTHLFAKRTASGVPPRSDGLPTAFVRFGVLDPSWYTGKVGRPSAKRVFFADFAQADGKTLRAAMTDTGSASLVSGAKPGQFLFIWVYAPSSQGPTEGEVASWHALFAALEQTPVK